MGFRKRRVQKLQSEGFGVGRDEGESRWGVSEALDKSRVVIAKNHDATLVRMRFGVVVTLCAGVAGVVRAKFSHGPKTLHARTHPHASPVRPTTSAQGHSLQRCAAFLTDATGASLGVCDGLGLCPSLGQNREGTGKVRTRYTNLWILYVASRVLSLTIFYQHLVHSNSKASP